MTFTVTVDTNPIIIMIHSASFISLAVLTTDNIMDDLERRGKGKRLAYVVANIKYAVYFLCEKSNSNKNRSHKITPGL